MAALAALRFAAVLQVPLVPPSINAARVIQATIDDGARLAAELAANGSYQATTGEWPRVRVSLPDNALFMSGPIFLQSNVDFHIGTNTTLQGSLNFEDYTFAWSLWGYARLSLLNGARCVANSTSECTSYAALSNVSVTGDGPSSLIDGQGHAWWYATNFWPNGQTLGRNPMLELQFITGLYVSNLRLIRPPAWTLHPWMCTDVLVERIVIDTGVFYSSWPYEGFNTDGVEPDNCANVVIRDSLVHAGDDCIAIDTSFRGNDYYQPIITHNVTVSNVTCRTPISIGARTTPAVYNVTIVNVTVDASAAPTDPYGLWRPRWYASALRIKSHDGSGNGTVSGVTVRDVIVNGVDAVVNFQVYYDCFNSSGPANTLYCEQVEFVNGTSTTPTFFDISYENIRGSAWRAAWLVCSPQRPCYGISFTNVSLSPVISPTGGAEGPYGYDCTAVSSVIDGGGNFPPVTGCAPSS